MKNNKSYHNLPNELNLISSKSITDYPLTAVLKKIDDKELSLDKKIELKAEDLDIGSGSLGIKSKGHIVTIKGLLIDLIVNSNK